MVTVGLLSVVAIWTIDVLTGPYLSVSLFYLLPVALVTWRLGRLPGTLVAALSAAAFLTSELMGGFYPEHSLIPYWNGIMRFGMFLIVALLLATIQGSLQRQRELAAQEAKAAEDLRELNDFKDTLLHAVSHDLKAPITAILGAAQALERREQLQLTPDQEAGLLEAIAVSGKRLNRMVSDLLDLERLDRGMIEPECELTDLAELANRMVREVDILREHPVRVLADPVEISVDAAKVERILANLLSNAAKHTPVGTPVIVRVSARSDGVVLSVEDEGPGIPDDLKQTVFQPFRQGEAARSAGSGAGIGLSLVAKFAELHGGNAWVEDREGGGTAIRVFLPGAVIRSPIDASAPVVLR
jgi:signal transduction histidine kinase